MAGSKSVLAKVAAAAVISSSAVEVKSVGLLRQQHTRKHTLLVFLLITAEMKV